MRTLRNESDCRRLIERVEALQPDAEREWGTMDAHRMICHAADQLRVALGDVETKDRSNLFFRSVVKWLLLYLNLPEPKGKVDSVPEMLTHQPEEWASDQKALVELIERLGRAEQVFRHPVFGRMSVKQWQILGAKHVDYHLRQFGG